MRPSSGPPALRRPLWGAAAAFSTLFAVGLSVGPADAAPPDTLFWEGEHLQRVQRSETSELTEPVREALDDLRKAADDARDNGPYSVVNKQVTPPSGDKHDYLSYSRYWWPNPDTEDGLPFVRHDGRVNRKQVNRGDRQRIGRFYKDFESLALAAYLLDEDRYAPQAVRLLRAWFLDPETRMNPNLNFAQGVPGVAEGRGPGVIDTRHFLYVLDGVMLLDSLDRLEEKELEGLRLWFGEFLDWLLTSDLGRHEHRAMNNHGAWFAAQASGIALFVGREEMAERLIAEVRDERLTASMEADGAQPEELKRTQSLHYSLFSLSAIATTARYGERVGIDLWNHRTESGASIRLALDYAAPHVVDQDDWEHPTQRRFAMSDSQSPLFYLAASRLDEPKYLEYLDRSPKRYDGRHLTPLLFSAPSR